MTNHPHSWGRSPPHSPPGFPPSSSGGGHHPGPDWWASMNGHAVPMLLGRLLERSDHLLHGQNEIKVRLEEGSERFEKHEARIVKLETKPAMPPQDEVTWLERMVKRWSAFLLPPLFFLVTGSWETAFKWIAALK